MELITIQTKEIKILRTRNFGNSFLEIITISDLYTEIIEPLGQIELIMLINSMIL